MLEYSFYYTYRNGVQSEHLFLLVRSEHRQFQGNDRDIYKNITVFINYSQKMKCCMESYAQTECPSIFSNELLIRS